MTLPVSPHQGILAGGIVSVTGTLRIDTGLRDLQSANVSLVSTPAAGAAHVSWSFTVDAGGSAILTIKVWDSTYTASVVATQVSWTALGK